VGRPSGPRIPTPAADRPLGGSVGANGWAVRLPAAAASGVARPGRRASARPPTFDLSPPPSGGAPGPGLRPGYRATIVTWLILPVVICLSQRLSHACLSISNLYGETANGLDFNGPFGKETAGWVSPRPYQIVGLSPAARTPWFNDYKVRGRSVGVPVKI